MSAARQKQLPVTQGELCSFHSEIDDLGSCATAIPRATNSSARSVLHLLCEGSSHTAAFRHSFVVGDEGLRLGRGDTQRFLGQGQL